MVIELIQGCNISNYPDLIDQMHKLRANQFGKRLGWNVEVKDDRERDKFDDLNPLYALSIDHKHQVNGSMRFLQTTGTHMLSEIFHNLLPDKLIIRSPMVWESSRFCVDTDRATQKNQNGLNRVTGELICTLIEIGLYAGLSHIVSVIDLRMERIIKRAGCMIERFAEPIMIGNIATLAVPIECSEENLMLVKLTNGINKPCFNPKIRNQFDKLS